MQRLQHNFNWFVDVISMKSGVERNKKEKEIIDYSFFLFFFYSPCVYHNYAVFMYYYIGVIDDYNINWIDLLDLLRWIHFLKRGTIDINNINEEFFMHCWRCAKGVFHFDEYHRKVFGGSSWSCSICEKKREEEDPSEDSSEESIEEKEI